ncbi:MAG TPA: ribbon-helix-helix domain-containing protein, partial [Alphaproteobacteria bacterium]|nr:ribbon-helix-helix domain-containing protein [Alphaproteobacteria bacterium]
MQFAEPATLELRQEDQPMRQKPFAPPAKNLPPRSTLINRNIMVSGRRTSVRLEPEMWTALLDIARRENQTIHAIATLVSERKKPETSLTAAIRV